MVGTGGSSDDDASTEEALGLFFRAASGIRDKMSGDVSGDRSNVPMDRDDEGQGPGEGDATSLDPSSCSDPLLQHLVKLLRSIMSGFPAAGFDSATVDAVSALEYYETLMLFFEPLGCSLGAMRCARGASRG